MKSSLLTLLSRPEIAVETATTKLENIHAMVVIESQVAGTKGYHLTAKGKVSMITIKNSRVKAVSRIVWLAETHGIVSSWYP